MDASEPRINKSILWIAVGLIVLSFGYLLWYSFAQQKEGISCTQDARLCPNGSYVGRTGPACEFAPCPSNPDGWRAARDEETGISFIYPDKLPTVFVSTVDWPPKINIKNGPFICTETGSSTQGSGQTLKQNIDGREYCITKISGAAAGSMYTQYAYAFARENRTAVLAFTLRAPQCANYEEPQRKACENEMASFSMNSIVGRIVDSIQ